MLKKLVATLLCFSAVVAFSMPVFAQDSEEDAPDTTVQETQLFEDSEVITVYDWNTGQANSNMLPVDMKIEMMGEVPYITKVYQFDSDVDISVLPSGFEQDGYMFERMEILYHAMPDAVDTKTVTKTITAECEKEDVNLLLALVASELQHSENGYNGTLTIDPATAIFSEAGTERYSYRVNETKEYTGLDRNDMAYVAKTIEKNGVTLSLADVEWQVMGTTPTDDGPVPSLYTAIATYTGNGSGSRVSGYTATVSYSGEVEKVTPGAVQYAVVFRGVVIEEPVEETNTALHVIMLVAGFALLLVVVFVVCKLLKAYHKHHPKTPEVQKDEPIDEGLEDWEI